MVLNVHRNHKACYYIRDGENAGKGVWRWGKRESIYTYRYTVTTRMTCIKMGSDESHFNGSLIVRDKVTRPCPQTITFEEKGELKWYRTEVLPLTSQTPQCKISFVASVLQLFLGLVVSSLLKNVDKH